jgi:hypothetical protein
MSATTCGNTASAELAEVMRVEQRLAIVGRRQGLDPPDQDVVVTARERCMGPTFEMGEGA